MGVRARSDIVCCRLCCIVLLTSRHPFFGAQKSGVYRLIGIGSGRPDSRLGTCTLLYSKEKMAQSSSAREDANDLAGLPLLGPYFRLAGPGRRSRADRTLGARAAAVSSRLASMFWLGLALCRASCTCRTRAMCSTCWGFAGDLWQRALLCAGPDLSTWESWRGVSKFATADYGNSSWSWCRPAEFHLRRRRAQPAHWQEGHHCSLPPIFSAGFALRHLCFCSVRYHAADHA